MTPETLDVAETAKFLRRFADLMSNGQNASYLKHAAVLLETLTARLSAALDEEQLWRYKYEAAIHHGDMLEAECDALKHDIEGHLNITTSILAERDALKTALQARDAELSELNTALHRERDELATKSGAHESAVAELRVAFDRDREALKAAAEARGEELDQLRRASEREREELTAKSSTREAELAELRLAFGRERDELQSQLKARGDEFAAFRVDSERECDALRVRVAALETKRAELRAAFGRIGDLGNQTIEHNDSADRSVPDLGAEAEATPLPAQRGDRGPALGEADAVVPKATLRQARAQFDYLANEYIRRGDIVSQVMCVLGAYTMDLALVAGGETDHLPVGEVALSILAPRDSSSLAVTDTK
jgi:predicted  nucleic acid-binding Zn-ribbon protein